jgi:hypothetical protein
VPLLGLLEFLFEMKDNTLTVFAEKASALLDGQRVRWTACIFSVLFAAKHAFHSHPLSDHDVLRVDPLEIREAMLGEQLFQLLSTAHSDQFLVCKHCNYFEAV